jgi:hypothetical protein
VPNGRSRIGQNRECWVPRPTATRPLDLALFEFVGQLFGAAVRVLVLLIIFRRLKSTSMNFYFEFRISSFFFSTLLCVFYLSLVRPQVRTRVYLDLALPSIVWKQLVQQPVTEADVIAIDVLAFNLINQVRWKSTCTLRPHTPQANSLPSLTISISHTSQMRPLLVHSIALHTDGRPRAQRRRRSVRGRRTV